MRSPGGQYDGVHLSGGTVGGKQADRFETCSGGGKEAFMAGQRGGQNDARASVLTTEVSDGRVVL